MAINRIIVLKLVFICLLYLQTIQAKYCDPIEVCSPQFVAFDSHIKNRTIQITCHFNRLIDQSEIQWEFRMEKHERIIKDLDDQILAPFKHQLINKNSPKTHTMSVLTIPLINSSYYNNYTIMSVPGSCYQTIRINYQETGALGMMMNNSAWKNIFSPYNLLLLLFIILFSIHY